MKKYSNVLIILAAILLSLNSCAGQYTDRNNGGSYQSDSGWGVDQTNAGGGGY